jgi:multidrug efflux pump subunit AcrB
LALAVSQPTKTEGDFALVGMAAAMLIYLIMAIQFRSLLQPLFILMTVPVALAGAIVLLAITRVGLDISVGMGILTLIGIAVNNAIVLLDYANRQVAAGQRVVDALQSAVSVRLRPITMAALTTIFALFSVAVDPAVGSRIFQPFANYRHRWPAFFIRRHPSVDSRPCNLCISRLFHQIASLSGSISYPAKEDNVL